MQLVSFTIIVDKIYKYFFGLFFSLNKSADRINLESHIKQGSVIFVYVIFGIVWVPMCW